MNSEVAVYEAPPKIQPEAMEVVNVYLQNLSIVETSRILSMPKEDVVHYLNIREVKRYVDEIFMQQGYLNKYKIQNTLEMLIEKKLEECEESEVYSSKDIADLLALAHKFRMEELKESNKMSEKGPENQVNIQNNFGQNYSDLMTKLLGIDDADKS